MWFFTTGGFYSAVQHRDNPDMFLVRARDRQSLETMLEGIEVAGAAAEDKYEVSEIYMAEGGSDYPWRVEVSKATFAIFAIHEILNYTGYDNFKSELKKSRGPKWEDAAMDVWMAMHKVEDTKEHRKWVYHTPDAGLGSGSEDQDGWGPLTQEEVDLMWDGVIDDPTPEELAAIDAEYEITSGQGVKGEDEDGKN